MLSSLAQRFRDDVAPRLIERLGNGGVSSVVRVITRNPDPMLPPVETETATVFKSYAKGISAQMLAADPNLQVTDIRVIVAALVYQPEVGDMVQVNGEDRRVIRVDAIPAADDPVVYWFFVR